jgi:hypothetical protein
MKRVVMTVLAVLLIGLLAPAQGAAWGVRDGGVRHFHRGQPFHRFHRFHHHPRAFFFGLGVGAVATVPLWYPPAVAYPVYVDPGYPPPAPVYWYYCQNPAGYYPYVAECPGGWVPVVPPGSAQ